MTIIIFQNTSEERAFHKKKKTVCNKVYKYIYIHTLNADKYFSFVLCGKVGKQPRQ